MRSTGLLKTHGRDEVEASMEGLGRADIRQDERELAGKYQLQGHEMSVDGETITARRTWASWTAQSNRGVIAQRALLKHCYYLGSFHTASRCWLSAFLPPAGVIWSRKDDAFFLNLGAPGQVAALVWPLEVEVLPGNKRLFRLSLDHAEDRAMTWRPVLDEDDFMAVPCQAASPLRVFLLRGRKLDGPMCVQFVQDGKMVPMLEWAARCCFWQVAKGILDKLLEDRAVEAVSGVGVFAEVLALHKGILPRAPDKDLEAILAKRSWTGHRSQGSEDLPMEVLEEVADKQDVKDARASCLALLSRCWAA